MTDTDTREILAEILSAAGLDGFCPTPAEETLLEQLTHPEDAQ